MKVQKTGNRQITIAAEQTLDALRQTWGEIEYTRPKSVPDGAGGFAIKPVKITRVSPNKKYNSQFPAGSPLWDQYRELVSDADVDRINSIIEKHSFELDNCVSALRAAKDLADRAINPRSWESAAKMGTARLSSIIKYKGEEKARALVFAEIFKFCRRFGKRADVSDDDISDVAEHVLQELRVWTVADLKFVLAREMRNGKNIFRIDYPYLIGIFETAEQDRTKYRVEIAKHRHTARTANEKQARDKSTGGSVEFLKIKAAINDTGRPNNE